jgi:hypothetical protein
VSARRSASLIELLSAIVSRASPADWIMSLTGRLISGALKRENELLCKLRFRACGPDGLMRRRVLATTVWVPCALIEPRTTSNPSAPLRRTNSRRFIRRHSPPGVLSPVGPAVRKIDPRVTNESSSQTQDEMSNDFNTQNTTRCETPSRGQIIWQPIPSTDPQPTCE